MRSLLTVLVLAGIGVGLLAGTPAHSRPKKAAAAVVECQQDTDCMLVTDGCCSCSEGGKQRALPRKARDAYEKKRQAICKSTMCPQIMSEDQSCLGRAICKEKVCVLGQ
jgi:hypothetical protein